MKNNPKRERQSSLTLLSRLMFTALFSLATVVAFAQGKTLTGVVLDDLGDPVTGVNVVVVGTTNGIITDIDGNFTLSGVADNAIIRVSYIGYMTQEVSVDGRTSIQIRLVEDTQALEEVVVIGYGTARRSDVTGSLSRVSEKQIKERPVQNALQAMQGKASGVDITTANRPGEMGTIRIRGNRSINASNDPLYVVDGIPLASGSMADINPNDISSIEVLKDASATAIYGSRGANGVVLVSTKKGQTGRVSINYDGTETFTNIHSMTDWMNAGQTLDWQRSAYLNGGNYGGAYGNAPDPGRDFALFMNSDSYMQRILATAYQLNADGSPVLRQSTAEERARGYADMIPVYDASKLHDQKWTDLVTRTGIASNHQISLSAGTETSKLYISAAYLNQKSPMKDQDYERFTANINGEVSPFKWLKAGMSMNANHSIQNYGVIQNSSNSGGGGAKDSYSLARVMMPYAPAYDEDGNILNTQRIGLSANNPILNMADATNEYRVYSFMNSSFTEISFTPDLKYRMNFGTQYRVRRYGMYYGPTYTNPVAAGAAADPNTAYSENRTDLSWVLENLLFYNKRFLEKHDVGLTLLQSAQSGYREDINIRQAGITFPSSQWYAVQNNNSGTPLGYGTGYSKRNLASYMVRANYTFNDRYLLTATGRWDGASVLAVGNKWDFFPSVALAWKMEEESFIRDIDIISQMKMRGGWGVTGNSSVEPYKTSGSIYAQGVVFNKVNTVGYKSHDMPNKLLGWEKTSQINIGLDFGFLNNRVSGSVEYYEAKTSDLLMDRSIPAITGYAKIQANIGKTENKGFEFNVATVNINNGDFRWQTDFNFSTNKEKIVELNEGAVDDKTNGWFIGHPIAVFRDYKYDRLWSTSDEDARLMQIYRAVGNHVMEPGQSMVVDQQPMIEVAEGTTGATTYTLASGERITLMNNGFGRINDDDMIILGSNRPDWVGGITNTFNYKNWELNFFVYVRAGNLYYGALQTHGRRVENSIWSETNQNADFYRPTSSSNVGEFNFSRNYTSGTMVAVRNIALSYRLPENLLSKFNVQNASVYAQVLNPFMWGGEAVKLGINPEDTRGWDAKTNGTFIGGQTNNTVLMRSLVLGVRLGF